MELPVAARANTGPGSGSRYSSRAKYTRASSRFRSAPEWPGRKVSETVLHSARWSPVSPAARDPRGSAENGTGLSVVMLRYGDDARKDPPSTRRVEEVEGEARDEVKEETWKKKKRLLRGAQLLQTVSKKLIPV